MTVDHLVYAGPNLTQAIERVEQLVGVTPTPGGPHPGRGTRNALLALGPATYIEIIGPDPDQEEPELPRPFGIDALDAPTLVTWAAPERDLTRRVQAAAARGVTLGLIGEGSRKRPDGTLLRWRYTDPRTVIADGLVPFFIDWGTTPHPAATAARGGALIDLRAEHPRPDAVRETLEQLDLTIAVTAGIAPALIATIDSSRGRISLR